MPDQLPTQQLSHPGAIRLIKPTAPDAVDAPAETATKPDLRIVDGGLPSLSPSNWHSLGWMILTVGAFVLAMVCRECIGTCDANFVGGAAVIGGILAGRRGFRIEQEWPDAFDAPDDPDGPPAA
jgi:hypothetical protein